MTGELISLFATNTPPASQAATGQPAGLTLAAPAHWPSPPANEAFHGLPGAIVDKIAPHTEADPVAILTQLLVCCGALIGRGAWFQVEATRHHPNQFLLLIGDSSRARKGSSLDHVTKLLTEADPAFPSRLTTGLSSGEGLVWKVRDPSAQDPGTDDKRLLVIEPEFASVLKSTGCGSPRGTLCRLGDDAEGVPGRVDAAAFLGQVKVPVRGEVVVADEGAELEDGFG